MYTLVHVPQFENQLKILALIVLEPFTDKYEVVWTNLIPV